MKHIVPKLMLSLACILMLIISCKKEPKCDDISITLKKTDANLGINNGSITVTAPKGTGFTYSINGGNFTADSTFANLGIGAYSVTVKNSNGCTSTKAIDIVNPCNGINVVVVTTKVDAITGQSNGSVTITSPVGSGVQYSINGGALQASANFNNLTAGTYTLLARTAAGCTGSTTATLNGYGPKYYAVKQLILGYCGPCHLNGGNSGGVNYDTDANIVAKWDRIKARAVDNVPSVMPQGGPLTTIDKQKITDWVNAGHTTSN